MARTAGELGSLASEVATAVALASPLHGPRHWRDVARLGLAVCDGCADADRGVVLTFAALHDTQRLSEGRDADHGRRAARRAGALRDRLGLSVPQMAILIEALDRHADGTISRHPTIGACWDADRLTLGRVGIVPVPTFFSTDEVIGKFADYAALGTRTLAAADCSWEALGGRPRSRRVRR